MQNGMFHSANILVNWKPLISYLFIKSLVFIVTAHVVVGQQFIVFLQTVRVERFDGCADFFVDLLSALLKQAAIGYFLGEGETVGEDRRGSHVWAVVYMHVGG